MFDLGKYLAEKSGLVDSYLREYFSSSRIRPLLLKESMEYSVSAGGKRIRPVLAIASYEACGGENTAGMLHCACALELVHTYSLIHDDLPAMDDDDLRRGKPTNHKVYGEAMAILAGDGLLTEAFRMLSAPCRQTRKAETGEGGGAGVLLAVIADLAARAGLLGMVAGQAQDIISETVLPGGPRADRRQEVQFIHVHKTAQLITASVRMGAMLSGADAGGLQAMTGYGEAIGLAFQIADDILDVKGETALMGKTAGSDERKQKLTYPLAFGMEASEREAADLVGKALSCLEGFGDRAQPLRAIAGYIIERKS
ncbi:MAG: polyprenyl synthetase family protein [Nitrospiraceae bacterium]|nr:polyprenyl synthetase family protein [Nitrospiraceae bacterium]